MRKIFSNLCARLNHVDVFNKKIFTVLYSSAFVCLMVISVAQIGLKNTNTRDFFTKIDSYEGAYFEVTAEVTPEPEYYITLDASADDFDGAEIWINGEVYSPITQGINRVDIVEASVIEIYAPHNLITVNLSEVSDGIILYTNDREITVENGLKTLGRVGIR